MGVSRYSTWGGVAGITLRAMKPFALQVAQCLGEHALRYIVDFTP